MTSYTVQFTLPLTHAHSTQDPFNHVWKFFRNLPLTSRHTGLNNRSHTTELFEVQVHFFFGSSNQTSPGFLVFFWLSMQVKPIGGGTTTNVHCTCIGPIHERVKKTPPFHTLTRVLVSQCILALRWRKMTSFSFVLSSRWKLNLYQVNLVWSQISAYGSGDKGAAALCLVLKKNSKKRLFFGQKYLG